MHFAVNYSSFWRTHTPTLEHFIRRLNLDGVTRSQPPMLDRKTGRRALIAEYAFALFVEQTRQSAETFKERMSNIEESARREACARLMAIMPGYTDIERDFDAEERNDVNDIVARLRAFFGRENKTMLQRPVLSGCGYIDSSEADILFGSTIFEIKTVDRPFRGTDFRQLLTYSALNLASRQFIIEKLGVMNPRRGVWSEIGLEEICDRISGRTAMALLSDIVFEVSSGEMSR